MFKNSSSESQPKSLLTQTPHLQAHPKIKPIIHKGSLKNPLGDRKLQKYLIFPSKPSSSTVLSHVPTKPKSPSLHSTRRYLKALKTQGPLSRLNYTFPDHVKFQSEYLCSKLRNLSSLTSLHLRFSGHFSPLKALTKNISSLKNLTDVKIQFHTFHFNTPEILEKLFKSLGALRKLTSLSMRFTMSSNFQGRELDVLSSNLERFPHLKALQLSFDCYLCCYDHDLEDLADSLGKLKNLTKIDLNLSGERYIDGSTLIRFFKNFSSLKDLSDISLNLRSCEIDNRNGFDCLAEGLAQLTGASIKKLRLYLYRNFDEKSLVKISRALGRFNELDTLCLNFYGTGHINNEGMIELVRTLQGFSLLSSLSITFPTFVEADFHVKEIALALRSMQKITHLQLDFARNYGIITEHVQELFTSLKSLNKLEVLDLSLSYQKSLSEKAMENLSKSLKNIMQLKYLFLNFNRTGQVTNKGVEFIIEAVKEMKELKGLMFNLGYNENIDEKAIDKIAQAIMSMKSLHSVNLSFNKCAKIMEKGDSLVRLFDALKETKNIGEVYLCLSYSEINEQETNELKQRKSLQTFWA